MGWTRGERVEDMRLHRRVGIQEQPLEICFDFFGRAHVLRRNIRAKKDGAEQYWHC